MRARDLADDFPTVSLDSDAMVAAQLMAARRTPGLIVTRPDGTPYTVLPGSQVLRYVVPTYVQDNPHLARVLDEQASDELCRALGRKTVRDLLPSRQDVDEIPIVDEDATMIEVAAVMARMHSPVVAVVDGDRVLGAITVSRLLNQILPA